MNPASVLRLLDDERRRLVRDGEIIDSLPNVTRLSSRDGSHHTIIHSSLTSVTTDAAIRQEIDHHARLEVEFEWKVFGHDQPPDLLTRLKQHGFEIGPDEAVMVLDLADRPGWIEEPPPHVVTRVEQLDQIGLFRKVAEAVFGKDYQFTANQLAERLQAGSTQHLGYIAFSGEEPVSVGRLYTHPESAFGGLYGGGTLAMHRGCGFYRAVLAARARDAATFGVRYLMVDALPTSAPILERLGFTKITDTWPGVWRPKKPDGLNQDHKPSARV